MKHVSIGAVVDAAGREGGCFVGLARGCPVVVEAKRNPLECACCHVSKDQAVWAEHVLILKELSTCCGVGGVGNRIATFYFDHKSLSILFCQVVGSYRAAGFFSIDVKNIFAGGLAFAVFG